MSKSRDNILADFFARHAAAATGGDPDIIARSYFKTYLEAAPGSIRAIPVNADYRKALVEQAAAMKKAGLKDARARVARVQEWAPAHVIADVDWEMDFTVPKRGAVTSAFRISYILRLDDGGPLILMYVSHEDQQAAMERAGIAAA